MITGTSNYRGHRVEIHQSEKLNAAGVPFMTAIYVGGKFLAFDLHVKDEVAFMFDTLRDRGASVERYEREGLLPVRD